MSYSHRGKPPTTIGAKKLNYCVRDGNRCILLAITTKLAWQRPTLTGGNPQLPSALKSLTTVFGMGTGVSSLLSSPNSFFDAILLVSCAFRCCLIVSIVTYHKYAPQSTQSRLEILRFISEFISLAWII